jgi:hypothetical protein
LSKAKKSESNTKNPKTGIIPWIVFLFSISIVLISFVSVIFPALILASDTVRIPGIDPVTPDPYETGVWSGGVIITNIIIFALAFLYFKNKLPSFVSSIFKKIFSFEISKKYAFIILLVLLTVYTVSSAGELSAEETLKDYQGVKDRLETWSPDQIKNFEPHVKYFFLKSSMILFGNYKMIPLLASVSLLITTYFLTKKITNKRFAGIISVLVLMQSSVFLTYDTSVSYDNFWILFYLVSLYAVYKFWPLSPISYLLSIPSKALTVAFLPISIYFILRSDISKRQKILTAGITAAIILAGGIAMIANEVSAKGTQEEFNSKEFWMGFVSFANQLRFDGLIILFMIPLMVGLFIVSRHGVRHGESMMLFISGMLLIAPILTGFTNQTNQPYRFVPLVVFFAVGVGVLLSDRSNKSPH